MLTVHFKFVEDSGFESSIDTIYDVVHLHESLHLRLVTYGSLGFSDLLLNDRFLGAIVMTIQKSGFVGLQSIETVDIIK